ncbi:unnamed protein product [Lactuca saligna]|uniref:Myb/SANT-like domain-containing protein n=1 Tax=Lactuca saligna TaxID=75948 RepID=A0AA35ZLJ3_LACSI|nr:unnamed protein product [Lactuca saligna]
MKFIKLCLVEKEKGHKPGTHFNKTGWANLEKAMQEETGKVFTQKQIKNKWDNLKKDWKLYDRLMRLETGIGGTRSLLDASAEWWEEKIKVDKDFAKFRGTNLSIYETYYAPSFWDSVATRDHSMTPLQFLNDDEREDNMEGNGDNEEINLGDDEPLFPSFPQTSSSKRKKSKDISNNRSTKTKSS